MLLDFIQSFGISQHQLQIAIAGIVVMCIVGTILVVFWKYIVAGTIAIFCLMVFSNAQTKEMKEPTAVVVQQDEDEKAYMEDCLNMTDYTKEQCKNIWHDREGKEN
jgi:hypothetical protein